MRDISFDSDLLERLKGMTPCEIQDFADQLERTVEQARMLAHWLLQRQNQENCSPQPPPFWS